MNSDPRFSEPLSKVFAVASKHLVDSNVFVRSVFLSLQLFAEEDKLAFIVGNKFYVPYNNDDCILFAYLQDNATRLLLDLLYVVDVFSHENICCLNTALLFLFASPRGTANLLAEMEWLSNDDGSCGLRPGAEIGKSPLPVIHRVRMLIEFWREFYIYRPLNVANLEASSAMSFERWWKGISDIDVALYECDSSSGTPQI
jgi:Protein of unknown function (DUF3689)